MFLLHCFASKVKATQAAKAVKKAYGKKVSLALTPVEKEDKKGKRKLSFYKLEMIEEYTQEGIRTCEDARAFIMGFLAAGKKEQLPFWECNPKVIHYKEPVQEDEYAPGL